MAASAVVRVQAENPIKFASSSLTFIKYVSENKFFIAYFKFWRVIQKMQVYKDA
jgi:hypothetical protein